MDAVIHNAGIYSTTGRAATPEGHASVLAVNTLAPYMLTALIERPGRLIYLSTGMHRSGDDVFATTVPDPIEFSWRPWKHQHKELRIAGLYANSRAKWGASGLRPILLCEATNRIRAVMNPRCRLSKRSLPMQAVLWSGPCNETISASSVPEFCTILLPEPIGATLASQLTRRTCVR